MIKNLIVSLFSFRIAKCTANASVLPCSGGGNWTCRSLNSELNVWWCVKGNTPVLRCQRLQDREQLLVRWRIYLFIYLSVAFQGAHLGRSVCREMHVRSTRTGVPCPLEDSCLKGNRWIVRSWKLPSVISSRPAGMQLCEFNCSIAHRPGS